MDTISQINTIKHLEITRLSSATNTIEGISQALNDLPRHNIEKVNWQKFPYLPNVQFAMAYDEDHIYLKYFVKEKHAQAVTDFSNGPVWEDSCCEFFCAFDNTGYYNLETNCIGTQLLEWHGVNSNKLKGDESTLKSLQAISTLGNKAPLSLEGDIEWDLTLVIPASTFFMHKKLKFFPGEQYRANLYKCGDKTRIPHFVSWNEIILPEPNFHCPNFFGQISLV